MDYILDRWAFETGSLRGKAPQFVPSNDSAASAQQGQRAFEMPVGLKEQPIESSVAKFETLSKESIEFSSIRWLENKRKIGKGLYVYRCEIQNKFGQTCGKDIYKIFGMCKQHWAKRGNC